MFLWRSLCRTSGDPLKLMFRRRMKRFVSTARAPFDIVECSSPSAQELLASLSANAASMLHLVRERVADSIGQQCSTQ